MILHPIIDLLKRIVVALPDYAGGGGSLPSIISKIDGGSFTPANDLNCSSYNIAHTLGVVPKGFIIWTEDDLSGTSWTRYMATASLSVTNVTASNDTQYIAMGTANILYNGNPSNPASNLTSSTINGYMTTSAITWGNSLINYKSGLTYKWMAWV